MAAGYRSLLAFWAGSLPPRQAGVRSLLAFWVGGGATGEAVAPVVETPKGGRLPRRIPTPRTPEYEEWLRALAEGRPYVPDDEPAPRRRRKRKARPVETIVFGRYDGDFLADIVAQPTIAAALDVAAHRDYRAAYEAARAAHVAALRRQEEDEIALILLLAA